MPTVQSGQANLYYEVHGSGPAIIFAHGRGGNATVWWQQIPHFSGRYTCIPYDQRTFGRSRGGGEQFTQEQLAGDLVAILEAEGIAQAAVVAQSMGGWSGLGAAVTFPDRVACLVMSSTHGGLEPPEAPQEGTNPVVPGVAPLGGKPVADGFEKRAPALALLNQQLRTFNTGFDPDNMDRLRDPALAFPPTQLATCRVPTLFVIGEHDTVFPPAMLRRAAARITAAEVAEISGVGHSPYWEDAPRFHQVLDDFFARHYPG